MTHHDSKTASFHLIPDLGPWLAVAATGVACAIVPFAQTPSKAYLLVFVLIAIASLLCARFDRQERWKRIVFWPALLLVAVFACSIINSPLRSVLWGRFWTMPALALLMPIVQIACWRTMTRQLVLVLVLLTVLSISIDMMIQRWTGWSFVGTPIEGQGNVLQSGSLGNPNDLAVMVVLLPVALASLPRRLSPIGFIGFGAVLACTNVAAVLTVSRQVLIGWLLGAWASVINQADGSGWRRIHTTWILMALFALFCLQFIGVPWLSSAEHGGELRETIAEGLGSDRTLQFQYAWWLFTQMPWLGIGLGGFGEHWSLGIINGWTWEGTPLIPVGMPWVHNLGLEVLCETGVAGGLTFIICLAHATWRCLLGVRRGGDARRLAFAVLGSGMVFLIVGIVDLSFIKNWVRVIFWLGLGLASVAGSLESSSKESIENPAH